MMQTLFEQYIQAVSTKFNYAETSEMGYRTDLEVLLKGIFETINVRRIDHDAKARQGNKPDFVIVKNDVPILYIEAKDLGVSLDKVEKSEQMSRYFGYGNLVLTDYVEFRFYRNGVSYVEPIKIAEFDVKSRTLNPKSEKFEFLAKTLLDFTQSHKEQIRSGLHLAKIMGGKAQRIRDNIRELLVFQTGKDTELLKVYETIKRLLVHDLTANEFADMYAQTLVYGLFVARFYDNSLGSFNRQEARDLIPASNPFLGNFFDHIAGRNFEKRLSYIVDELCEVFTHANVAQLMEQHFKTDAKKGIQRGQDQVIHFYEDFLREYDDQLRKKMGAYYTPLPIVQFIVRSVDYLLEKEFNLPGGLSNTSKTEKGLHKVQILDPAVGTGTFISDVIGKIYTRIKKAGQTGRWPSYVHHDLLPRLFGFELMMAPYTIAHLKLSMALKETGFLYFNETRSGKARLGIYLTNSLEEVNKQPELLAFDFGASIAQEAKEASKIKNEKPIMVVVGNPPYSVSSSNKGLWIQNLIKDYKTGLKEQNTNSLSDDYVKFLRFAEYFIEKNKTGIVAMITNNSFIDGLTHRQMRKHLLETFDDIYILDLHGGNRQMQTNKQDENVFDIRQGVSINIFVRKNIIKKELGRVYHSELFGTREFKFEHLNNINLNTVKWMKLNYSEPYYFFVPKNFKAREQYENGFKINELFIDYGSGIKFRKDNLLVRKHFNSESVVQLLIDVHSLDDASLHMKYDFKDTPDWRLEEKKKLFTVDDTDNIKPVQYRPFDIRYTYYPLEKINEIIPRGDSRKSLMRNFLKENMGLITKRGIPYKNLAFCTSIYSDMRTWSSPGTQGSEYVFPLYLHSEDESKIPNLNKEIVYKIEKIVGQSTPENIFDYIYSILYSPNYQEKYKEFLKIDFPTVPYPKDKQSFKKLVKLGGELREMHLMKSPKLSQLITTYPISGNDIVEKIEYKNGCVYINPYQCFGQVPEVAWSFWIGGYQPAQKWLKDRKGRTLTNEDIEHYQKIIVSLTETNRLMKDIDVIYYECKQ